MMIGDEAQMGSLAMRQRLDGEASPTPCLDLAAPGGDGPSDLVRRVIAFLEKRYIEPVKLRDLEAVTASNPYQIIRAFRRDLGTTPHAFMMRLRVERAMLLLIDGERIVDAAAETGFVDQSHLTKHFKRVCGTTPGKFLRHRLLRGQAAAEAV